MNKVIDLEKFRKSKRTDPLIEITASELRIIIEEEVAEVQKETDELAKEIKELAKIMGRDNGGEV